MQNANVEAGLICTRFGTKLTTDGLTIHLMYFFVLNRTQISRLAALAFGMNGAGRARGGVVDPLPSEEETTSNVT